MPLGRIPFKFRRNIVPNDKSFEYKPASRGSLRVAWLTTTSERGLQASAI
jgi:hypothetical protein